MLLCRRLDLLGPELVAVDGTRLKAVNSRRRNFTRQKLADRIKSGESQLLLTDPDARGMATNPKVGVGYNAQVAVDDRHKLIVEQYVTNSGSDLGFLAQTAGAAREILGVERINPVAEKDYFAKSEFRSAPETSASIGLRPHRRAGL